jgi:tagatose-1,6-bisphosphate aldolase non-catalytic subunit AgaZ/GatZ
MKLRGDKMETAEKVILNLQDADCPQTLIDQFLQESDPQKRLRLLSVHRRHLLDGIHDRQRKLDILDYLIFTMKQEQKRSV